MGVIIAVAAGLTLLLGPLALGIAGLTRERAPRGPSAAPWNWRRVASSALACTLAFNLTFFIQELFLVVPKALTPGLSPTLFHNDHAWTGSNPLAELFQGTGAVATTLSGATCALLLVRGVGRTQASRLFLLWMTYCGFFMALPQVAVGAVSEASDLGRAMGYLQLGGAARLSCALLALAVMPVIALQLARAFLELAPAAPATAAARSVWIFQVATLPAVIALALIIPFRVPRELIEVVIVPVAVMVAGIPWIQSGAAWTKNVATNPTRASDLTRVAAATLLLLAIFQLVLRPGIPFY